MLRSMYLKVPAALLLVFLMLSMVIAPVAAQSVPFFISGYVDVNGAAMNGVHVSCNGASYTTKNDGSGHAGYYAIMPSATNGSPVTVNFEYNGHTTSITVTANGGTVNAPTANIAASTVTPTVTPTATATVSPGSSGSGSSITFIEAVKATAKVSATPTPTAIAATVQSTTTAVPTQAPVATPEGTQQQGNNTAIYLVIGLVAVLAIAGAGYYLFMRKP